MSVTLCYKAQPVKKLSIKFRLILTIFVCAFFVSDILWYICWCLITFFQVQIQCILNEIFGARIYNNQYYFGVRLNGTQFK